MDGQAEQRITVIGSPGGGKSTLATLIARATGLPLVHLDREYWQPGWVEPDKADWRRRNAELVAAPGWVIDGNYGGSLPARLARATLVIHLDLPTRVCLLGILRRLATYRGHVRPDMREGCPEQLNVEFLRFCHYVLTFRRRVRPRVMDALATSDVRMVRLSSVAERAAFADLLMTRGLDAAIASPD